MKIRTKFFLLVTLESKPDVELVTIQTVRECVNTLRKNVADNVTPDELRTFAKHYIPGWEIVAVNIDVIAE